VRLIIIQSTYNGSNILTANSKHLVSNGVDNRSMGYLFRSLAFNVRITFPTCTGGTGIRIGSGILGNSGCGGGGAKFGNGKTEFCCAGGGWSAPGGRNIPCTMIHYMDEK
jgi:hypothetical protein